MESTCAQACVICNIDGFTGRNNSSIRGEAPSDFCTGQVHHMQWLGFIAGSTDIKIEFSVSNCQSNNGLEVGIYEGIDCKNYRKMSDCNTDIPPNTKWIFTNNKPLTIGQYYYWVMDGSANDICDYTIKVLEGSTNVQSLTKAPEILFPKIICENTTARFTTPGIIGGTDYDWFVNNTRVGAGFLMDYKFTEAGEYEISLLTKNACSQAPKASIKVIVEKSKRSSFKQEVCFDDCYNYQGKDYCKTGSYDIILKAANGCDSIVTLDLKVNDLITIDRKVQICEGDTFFLGKGKHWKAGLQEGFITDADGCKIQVNLTLDLIKCKIKANNLVSNIKCNNEKNGQIAFTITNGTPPIYFDWSKLENQSIKGSGTVLKENVPFLINNLDEGNYVFNIRDTFGNISSSTAFVYQPSKLKAIYEKSRYGGGFNTSCHDTSDGFIRALASGGTTPYSYNWNGVNGLEKYDNLKKGTHLLILTDQNKCSFKDSINVTSPLQIQSNIIAKKSGCFSPKSGVIDLKNIKNGVRPYAVTINGKSLINFFTDSLSKADYVISIKDSNQCVLDTTVFIDESDIPNNQVDTFFSLFLGDSVNINVKNLNNIIQKISWQPSSLPCSSCNSFSVLPIETSLLSFSATSKDGCVQNEKIKIEVIKKYDFLISNVITPNDDLLNDRPRYWTDNSVEVVQEISFYDRWGNAYFQESNPPKGFYEIDFDKGDSSNKKLENGIYVWIAKVKYIDGVIKNHHGIFNVLK
jgi:hypothetical protein